MMQVDAARSRSLVIASILAFSASGLVSHSHKRCLEAAGKSHRLVSSTAMPKGMTVTILTEILLCLEEVISSNPHAGRRILRINPVV